MVLPGEGKRMTLVSVFTLCYTGLGAEFGNPYAQIMAKSVEPRYQQKKDYYQQKQMTVHDILFGCFCDGLSN
jgi:hypothetical protein